MRVVSFGLALLLAVWPGELQADQRFHEVTRIIQQLLRAQQLPSVVVAVAKDGRIVWEEGFGWADRAREIRATPRTPYSLASISKPFTATAVMKLVESGRVELDRPANNYLGDARIAGRDAARATLRRVLSHTAGLPPFFRAFSEGQTPVPIEELIARHALLSSPPGRRHVYSNLGYGVLEHIIERNSGVSYEDFMRREIFLPLRLDDTSVPSTAPPDAAVRYDARDRALPFYDVGHRGASAVYASAHDLVRFGMFHLEKRIDGGVLTRRSIDEMQRIQTPESSTEGYGLGWRIDERSTGFRHVGHTGGMAGVTTALSLYPAQRLVVVVLANKRDDAVVRLAQKIAATVIPHYWRLGQ